MSTTVQETRYVIYVASTAEKVWDALTKAEYTEKYFFGRRIESSWKEGSVWALRMEDGKVDSHGIVKLARPPRLLNITWKVEWMQEMRNLPECLVTYNIDPLGDVVRVSMTEAHPTPIEEKYLEGGRKGWPIIMSGMKTLLETGRPLPEFEMKG